VSSHYSEDDLTLHYYGEGRSANREEIARHVRTCDRCAALYREISETLALVVAEDVPERGDQYGLEVWQRIRHQLPERGWWPGGTRLRFVGLVGAMAALVAAAFIAGQLSRAPGIPGGPGGSKDDVRAEGKGRADGDSDRERILLTAVADHLDRSSRVLTEIENAHGPSDISAEQRWAEDLVVTSRLYRQDATDAGELSVAAMLDDLERNLLEIVHRPSKISAADLEQIRRRLDAAALLFKVRIMSDELRQREAAAPGGPSSSEPRTSTSPIS
jgi:hypothetical protein